MLLTHFTFEQLGTISGAQLSVLLQSSVKISIINRFISFIEAKILCIPSHLPYLMFLLMHSSFGFLVTWPVAKTPALAAARTPWRAGSKSRSIANLSDLPETLRFCT